MENHYLVYVTANDASLLKDYIHLYHTCTYHPGISPIDLYVVVGGAKKFTRAHRWTLEIIMRMVQASKHIRAKAVIIKNNAGWDFGSAYVTLRILESDVQPDDFILVRNRSTWGPESEGWYKKYVDLYRSADTLALVGSTIGLNDHPSRKRTQNVVHVQTFVYGSTWKHLSSLFPDFPGRYAKNHLEAVLQGEIELSQSLMNKGWSISCLKNPDLKINLHNQHDISPAQLNSNKHKTEIPIRKDNEKRNWKYYFKILLILTTMGVYLMPGRKTYRWITWEQDEQK